MVTLICPGGTGKTRLALEIARQVETEFSDGVRLIDLAPLVDAALVPQTIASTVGVVEEPGRAVLHALTNIFKAAPYSSPVSVVRGAAAVVVSLLERGPGEKLLCGLSGLAEPASNAGD